MEPAQDAADRLPGHPAGLRYDIADTAVAASGQHKRPLWGPQRQGGILRQRIGLPARCGPPLPDRLSLKRRFARDLSQKNRVPADRQRPVGQGQAGAAPLQLLGRYRAADIQSARPLGEKAVRVGNHLRVFQPARRQQGPQAAGVVVVPVGKHHLRRGAQVDPHRGGILQQQVGIARIKQDPPVFVLQPTAKGRLAPKILVDIGIIIHQHRYRHSVSPLSRPRRRLFLPTLPQAAGPVNACAVPVIVL